MYWQAKYAKARQKKQQLIGDKVIRDVIRNKYGHLPILEEVRFKGFTADMAIIDLCKPRLWGIEVKSDRDDLDRLPEQLRGYLLWFNYVVVATTYRHKWDVLRIIQSNDNFKDVGVCCYKMDDEIKDIEVIRQPQSALVHPSIDWIGNKHQLRQWRYMLELIYGLGLEGQGK